MFSFRCLFFYIICILSIIWSEVHGQLTISAHLNIHMDVYAKCESTIKDMRWRHRLPSKAFVLIQHNSECCCLPFPIGFVCACLKYKSHRMIEYICVYTIFSHIFLFSFIRLELLLLLYYSWVVRSSFGRCRVKSLYDTSCGKWILKCASFNLKVCQLNRTEAEKKETKKNFQRRYAKKWPVNSTLCEKRMEIHMETNPKREHTHTHSHKKKMRKKRENDANLFQKYPFHSKNCTAFG